MSDDKVDDKIAAKEAAEAAADDVEDINVEALLPSRRRRASDSGSDADFHDAASDHTNATRDLNPAVAGEQDNEQDLAGAEEVHGAEDGAKSAEADAASGEEQPAAAQSDEDAQEESEDGEDEGEEDEEAGGLAPSCDLRECCKGRFLDRNLRVSQHGPITHAKCAKREDHLAFLEFLATPSCAHGSPTGRAI